MQGVNHSSHNEVATTFQAKLFKEKKLINNDLIWNNCNSFTGFALHATTKQNNVSG